MQRWSYVVRDDNGRPVTGASCSVYSTNTTSLANLYSPSAASDTPTTAIANPVITGSDGLVSFAAADGDYDVSITGSNITTQSFPRINFFDSTTAGIPGTAVSSVGLSMPAQFTVSGSPLVAPGSISVSLATQTANLAFAGPASGSAAAPTFRALVTADLPTSAERSIYNQIANVAVSNTVAETTLLTTAPTLAAAYLTAGKTLRIVLEGQLTNTGTPTIAIKVKLGATTVGSTGTITMVNIGATGRFHIEGHLTCRSTGGSGTVMCPVFGFYDVALGGALYGLNGLSAATTVDTTASNVVDVTVTWGAASASNLITVTNASISVLGG
jgi:hypothetical protein